MIRIANAQGFWGDRPDAAAQLLSQQPDLDFITLDYLAELSLSIMAIQREKEPSAGYAKDFLQVVESLIPFWKKGNTCRIVTNAGGLNPLACAQACKTLLQQANLPLPIGIITGDDVLSHKHHLENPPSSLLTANAYLGAKPIAEALQKGAHIVISGRVADPSLTVGPCVAHYGWEWTDYNRIAQATVAGHLIECGTQVTGGISNDWLRLPDAAHIGFPFVEVAADSTFIVTKPLHTGGEVSLHTVKEQLLYEMGDPAAYLSPDVTLSLLTLHLQQVGPHRIEVSGAIGTSAPPTLKVSAYYRHGYRAEGTLTIVGTQAHAKAKRSAQIILRRLQDQHLAPEQWHVECLGANNETVLRVAAADPRREVLEAFSKEIAPLVTSGAPGTTGYATGRPKVRPVFGYMPLLIPATTVQPKVEIL